VATPRHQRRNSGKHSQNARETHQPMLSWDRSATPSTRLPEAADRWTGHDLAFC
jgi:hypothetical protein